jgi:hypothetical protein
MAECGRAVYIVCGRCGRFITADLQKIAQLVGWRARVEDISWRLRCRSCNYRSAKLTFDRPRMGVCPRCRRPL